MVLSVFILDKFLYLSALKKKLQEILCSKDLSAILKLREGATSVLGCQCICVYIHLTLISVWSQDLTHCYQCDILQHTLGWNPDVVSPVKITETASVKIKQQCVILKCNIWPLKGKQEGNTPYSIDTLIQPICLWQQLEEPQAYMGVISS